MTTLTELTLESQRTVERSFAVCVLGNPDDALRKCAWLDPAVIATEGVRKFWGMILAGADPAKAALEAGIMFDVLGWTNDTPSTVYVEQYANEIKRRAYIVSTDPALAQLMQARKESNLEEMRRIIKDLNDNTPTVSETIPTAIDAALEFAGWLARDVKSIRVGITPIDEMLQGLDYSAFSILAARPSMGKSTIALQMARNVAQSGKKTIIFSNEMTTLQLWRKVACGSLGIDIRDLKAGRVKDDLADKLNAESMRLAELYADRLLIDDRTSHNIQTIWQTVARVQPDFVVVDILRNIKEKNDREVIRLGNIAHGLKDMANENNCHIMALHHLNRESAKASEASRKRPTLEDLRESGELEQTADAVFTLHCQAAYEDRDKLPEILDVEWWVLKYREGPRNLKSNLKFWTKDQWFTGRAEQK
jgi:replicative DNA helicase